MARPVTDLIFHPVRIRLLALLHRHSPATATELAALLPRVSQRTLYRHLEALLEGGMIRIARSRQVRGAVEHSYEPARPALLDDAETQQLTPTEWRQLFAFLTGLLQAEFSAFVEERHTPEGLTESHVRLGEITVTAEQLEAFIAETVERGADLEASDPGDGERETYRIGLIAFPLSETMH
ncbi:MAG: helix-turn-helix domain-containing protein [Anaerolineales bacterium]